MRHGALQDPRPVVVRLGDSQEVGIMIADDIVEVGVNGLPLDVNEAIELDGETFYVAGTSKRVSVDPAGINGAEITVRFRVETRP